MNEILELMKNDINIISDQFNKYLQNIDRPFSKGVILSTKYAAQEFIELADKL